jgi:hypothetical protein
MLGGYDEVMAKMAKTIEFETELTGSRTLNIPPEIAAALDCAPLTGEKI